MGGWLQKEPLDVDHVARSHSDDPLVFFAPLFQLNTTGLDLGSFPSPIPPSLGPQLFTRCPDKYSLVGGRETLGW